MARPTSADQFIRKWQHVELKERSAAQEHFIDLCSLLSEPTPAEADPTGSFYCFERGATKSTGGEGWADVWKQGHFGWEYKGRRKDLDAAFVQLQQYTLALENPPLLVVCDLNRFVIRTNWTNTVSEKHEFALEDLRDAHVLEKLLWMAPALQEIIRRSGALVGCSLLFGLLMQPLETAGPDGVGEQGPNLKFRL